MRIVESGEGAGREHGRDAGADFEGDAEMTEIQRVLKRAGWRLLVGLKVTRSIPLGPSF